MAGPEFSSANNDISVPGAPKQRVNPSALMGSVTKNVSKRWMIVGAAVASGILFTSVWMSSGKTPKVVPVRGGGVAMLDTTPKGLSAQKDWKAQAGADMLTLKSELESSKKAQDKLNGNIDLLREEIMQMRKNPPQAAAGSGGVAQNAGSPKINLTLPTPPTPPKSLMPGQGTVSAGEPGTAPSVMPMQPPAPPAPVEVKRAPARAFIPAGLVLTAAGELEGETTVEDMVPNARKGFLPGGSFSQATMISGVEAFTGGAAQSQPQPIVLRLDTNAILPNAANYQIKGCHVLASVWGDISSERVFGRLATLTCVDTANRLVLSEEVEGVLVDSDGKNGIRGALQDRQGAKLARSLLAGFAQGLSSALGAAKSTVSTTALGTTTAIMGKDVLSAGGYEGASTAANQLAEYSMKQAEGIMPIIAVDAGRKVSVLFTKSKALSFETTDAYRSQPKKKFQVERPVR